VVSGIAHAIPFSRGGAKSRFRSRRSTGPPTAPGGPIERVRTPPRLSVQVTIGINRQASPSGEKTTEMAVSDFVGRGEAAAPGGLRLPPCTPGSWKWLKNKNITINQWAATCGSPGELQGAMEVAPYDPGRNLVGAAASGCQKLPPPSLLVKKNPIKAQTTISRRDRTFGSPRDRGGGHGSDPLCPLFDLGRAASS